MKNHIDSNFAIAILALVAACVGFSFWLHSTQDDFSSSSSATFRASNESVRKNDTDKIVNVPQVNGDSLGGVQDTFMTEEVVEQSVRVNTEPSDLDTEDWTIYTNDQYGFSIKHPETWVDRITPDSPNTDFQKNVFYATHESDRIDPNIVTISKYDISAKAYLDRPVNFNAYPSQEWYSPEEVLAESILLNSKQVTKRTVGLAHNSCSTLQYVHTISENASIVVETGQCPEYTPKSEDDVMMAVAESVDIN